MSKSELHRIAVQRGQMNLFEGRLARDAGVAATWEDLWAARACGLLVQYARTRPEGFLAEEFRQWWHDQGNLLLPHNPHVWGALFLTVAKTGAIVNTGVYRQAASRKNHAHRYAVWKPKGD